MSQASRIEWTEATWNPTVGCTKISPGCKNCYAEAMAKRLQAMGTPGYENGFKLTILPERLADLAAALFDLYLGVLDGAFEDIHRIEQKVLGL